MIVDVTKNGVDIAEERELMTRARECFENFREGSEPLTDGLGCLMSSMRACSMR